MQPQRSPLKVTWSRGRSHRHGRRVQEHTTGGCIAEHTRHPPPANRQRTPRTPNAAQQTCNPASDYKCFNSSNVSIRSWSWNYRSCWHQTCPPVDTHHCVWIASIPSSTGHWDKRNCCSSSLPHQECVSIGQFACLLPSLEVVAVSQAPSPESNPDSPLPVTAMVVQYTTIKADRSEARVIKQCCGQAATTLPARVSTGDQPESTTTRCHFQALVLEAAGRNPLPVRTGWKAWRDCAVADRGDRVLATRFWRMSKRAPGRGGAIHTLSWR